MAWDVSSDPLDFEEAIEWFRNRVPVTASEWNQLSGEARRRAFNVAAVADADVINQVFQAIDKAVSRGTGFEEFQQDVATKLQNAWGEQKEAVLNPGWRMRNIFRTNLQSAYAAGRFKQQTDPVMLRSRPYWLYDAVLDNRTSIICRTLHGTLLPADHEFWKTAYPPNHFGGCRAGIRALTEEEAQARGGITSTPLQTPDTAFAGSPSLSDWDPDPGRYPEDLQGPLQRKLEVNE